MVEGDSPEPSAAAPGPDPLLGRVLDGRFTILEPLGVGGMGKVYKALQAPLDRLVALKILKPSFSTAQDPGFQKRFFLEASLTAKLHHPNTITVHDYGRTADGVFYIAMEYVEGQTLAALLAEHKQLPWARALNIGQQVCRSLREAHRLGILHRDLKPANVMLLQEESVNDVVKVLDFGLVKSFTAEHPKVPDHTDLTQAGVLLGSPLYMSPEQARNQSDPRSDVYSLGVVLYQSIAGRTPFEGRESIDVIVKHLRERAPSLRSLVSDVPTSVDALVMRCLAKDPTHRYQSMDEVLEAMRLAAVDAGISGDWKRAPSIMMAAARVPAPEPAGPVSISSNEVVEVPAPAAARRTRRIYMALFAGALTLSAVFAFLIVRGSREPSARSFPSRPRVSALPREPVESEPLPSSDPAPTEPVTFHVVTSPPGARVSFAHRDLGPAPVSLSVAPGPDGVANAELTLSLDGYSPVTLRATGSSPEVTVRPTLQALAAVKKKPAPPAAGRPKPAKPPTPPPGYKDDPYQ